MTKNVQEPNGLGVKRGVGALIGGGALNGEFTVLYWDVLNVDDLQHTLLISGAIISTFLSLWNASSSDSPNNVIGSPRSRNLFTTWNYQRKVQAVNTVHYTNISALLINHAKV